MNDESDVLSVNADSFRKFTREGFARKLPGISLVHFIDRNSSLFARIAAFVDLLEYDLVKAKLIGKFVFLPVETYHITVLDITLHPSEKTSSEIIRGTNLFFQKLRSERFAPPSLNFQNPYFTNMETLILKAEPTTAINKETIESIRNTLHEALAEIAGADNISPLREYNPHVTLAYLVESFSDAEHDSLIKILKKYQQVDPLGSVLLDTFELRKFESMEDWGKRPLLEVSL